MAETPVAHLRVHARQAPWNARGLAAHATSIVDAAGMRPTNAAARAALSARAVRFYVSTGLLDRPEGKGTAATYGYRHLLQLLAIKVRQREGQTLDTIKRELAEQTGDALERRIAQSLAPSLNAQTGAAAPADGSAVSWHRLTIANGVELNVRTDSVAALEENLEAMRIAIRGVLARENAL
jgi:DNA-binding transcriptional MerR regulator